LGNNDRPKIWTSARLGDKIPGELVVQEGANHLSKASVFDQQKGAKYDE
jgi:hypothetical protein